MSEPLREPTYFLLAALLDGPLHGYAIAQAAAALSDGRVQLTAGTLYGALGRLLERGLLREAGEEVVDGRRRRAYALTEEGRKVLVADAQRMRDASEVVVGRGAPMPVKAVGA